MKRYILLAGSFLAVFVLIPSEHSIAFTFPMSYMGTYTVKQEVHNQYGSGYCEGSANLSITLSGNGQLTFQNTLMAVDINEPSGQPPSCEVSIPGGTNTTMGTHDLNGNFSVPTGTPELPLVTGQYDANYIWATWRYGWVEISFSLPSSAHTISLEPSPSKGLDFQKSIINGQGFKIVVHDPHGRDHLDWNTFQLFVGGNDITASAMKKIMDGVVLLRDESPDSKTKLFRVVPDPKQLMTGQDIFSIPWNGDWNVVLKICDKSGICFQSNDTIYFGPFATVSAARDLRCGYAGRPLVPFVETSGVVVGNVGIDSPHTAIYVALIDAAKFDDNWTPRNGSMEYWTLHFGETGDGYGDFFWWQGELLSMLMDQNMPSGYLYTEQYLDLQNRISVPYTTGPIARNQPFPAGDFKFVTAAVDADTGAYRMDIHDILMCEPTP